MGVPVDDTLLKTAATADPEPLMDPDEWAMRWVRTDKGLVRDPVFTFRFLLTREGERGPSISSRVGSKLLSALFPSTEIRESMLGDVDERFASNLENRGEVAARRIRMRDYADIALSGIWNVVKDAVIRRLARLGFEYSKERFR